MNDKVFAPVTASRKAAIFLLFALTSCANNKATPQKEVAMSNIAQRFQAIKAGPFSIRLIGYKTTPEYRIDYYHNLQKQEGIRYLLLKLTYTNKEHFSRVPKVGAVAIKSHDGTFFYDPMIYEIPVQGWCDFYGNSLNPEVETTIRLIYKMPDNMGGKMYYVSNPEVANAIELGDYDGNSNFNYY